MIPTQEPQTITAGDTVKWTRALSDYPASDGWSLNYSLRGQTATAIDLESSASGSDHLISAAASETETWIEGRYVVQGYAVKDDERYLIFSGVIVVLPNLAGKEANFDGRSHARKVLDSVNAVIEGRAGHDILNSTVEGTVLGRTPIDQLLLLRDRYVVIVKNEEAANDPRARRSNRILTRFVRPT